MTVVGRRPATLAIAQMLNEVGAIRIVGCGLGRCRSVEMCDLPMEKWGKPYWGGDAVYTAVHDDENPYPLPDVDTEEPLI